MTAVNFDGFDFDRNTTAFLEELDRSRRMPHAILIECPDSEKASALATFLSMLAVCSQEAKPCGKCKNCLNAKHKSHPDIAYPKLLPKKKAYTVQQLRELMKDAYILPNDAAAKVYVFENTDERLNELGQNTFLKLFEEPPQNVYFILLCKSAQSMLDTILSRFTIIRIRGQETFDNETLDTAAKIIRGILATQEYPLLKTLYVLRDKDRAGNILTATKQSLRDALALLSGGEAIGDSKLARQLAARLTRKKLIEMIELCDSSEYKINQNVNINLLTAWLCGEFRRITWQR